MAEVLMHESETYRERMPEVCMACGQPAIEHIRKNFSWFPPWLGATAIVPILYIILAASMTKRMVVEMPICERHRNYFVKRQLWIWLSLLALGLLFGAILVAGAALNVEALAAVSCAGGGLAFVVWLIAVLVVQSMMIKPAEITDRSITLKCVHDRFAQAFFAMQDARDQRRRRLDDDDYDDRPRRRSAARDDYPDEPPPRRDSRTNIRPKDDFEE